MHHIYLKQYSILQFSITTGLNRHIIENIKNQIDIIEKLGTKFRYSIKHRDQFCNLSYIYIYIYILINFERT